MYESTHFYYFQWFTASIPDEDSFINYIGRFIKLLEKLIIAMVMEGNNADEREPILAFYVVLVSFLRAVFLEKLKVFSYVSKGSWHDSICICKPGFLLVFFFFFF